MKIQIQVFGGLRSSFKRSAIEWEAQADWTTERLKATIGETLAYERDRELLRTSALALATPGQERVLKETETLGAATQFALLPPVCGG